MGHEGGRGPQARSAPHPSPAGVRSRLSGLGTTRSSGWSPPVPRRPNLINRHSFDIGFLPASRVAVGTARWQGQGRASWEGSLLEPIISEVPHLDTALGSAVSRMFLRGHLHSHLSTPATPVTRQWQSASQGCAHLREPWGATGECRFALGAPRAFQRAWEMYFLAPRPLLLPLSPGSVK